jgi:hypothetical protein
MHHFCTALFTDRFDAADKGKDFDDTVKKVKGEN